MSRRRILAATTAVVAVAGLTQFAPATGADRAPRAPSGAATSEKYVGSALGNGLGRLVAQSGSAGTRAKIGGGGLTVDQASTTIRDAAGRVLVDLTPRAGTDAAAFKRKAKAAGLVITATDPTVGTLEGFVAISSVERLAGLADTGTIAQVMRPHTNVGATTSQGVEFQRVDKVLAKGVDGAGMTVGVLSDSYDTATTDVFGGPLDVHASDDVASGDLPGIGNPDYPQPVVVIEDADGGEDEGRAMLQIVHDLAPAAKLCFATAYTGNVGFADNIRKLADKSGPCGADVIVDDVGYGDESPYSDNVISDAVDDVTADGVTYLSAAGNSGDHQAWSSPLHLISEAKGVKGTNLDFSDVDPALYAGGLQDMDTTSGTDIAQTLKIDPDAGTQMNLMWDEGVDADGADLGDPYLDTVGAVTAVDPEPSFEFTPTADQLGKEVLIVTDGVPSGTVDLILDLVKPDGTEVGPIDTGGSPESLATELDQEGTYTITVSGFDGATGPFTLKVNPIVAPSTVTTDFNLLAFGPDGTYYGSLGDDNTLTGRPYEGLPIGGVDELQIVIARKTVGPTPVTHLNYVLWGEGYVATHFDPAANSVFGHPAAAGAIAVAAYDPFKSYLPEWYTSAGGKLKVSFDSAGQPYATPQVRRKPEVASTDRGNTTFFVSDDSRDADDFPNFGGTSAAAPHAAAIAALVLEKAGGPGAMTPVQVKTRLQSSTFAHDLDPFRASGKGKGKGKGLKVTAVGSQSDERNLTPGALGDPNFFRVKYAGKVPLKSITFYGETGSPTSPAGIAFDKRKLGKPGSYRDGGYPFTIGDTSGGLHAGAVSAHFAKPLKKLDGRFRHLTVKFSKHGLRHGQGLQFGIDRDLVKSGLATDPVEGNGADELGGATFIPSGKVAHRGLKFTAVRKDGKVIHGYLVNKIGKGWTAVDGYGLINAEKAVLGQ